MTVTGTWYSDEVEQVSTKNLHKDAEDEHFTNQFSKQKLEKDRQALHQAVDSVLTKLRRFEYRGEEEALDLNLTSGIMEIKLKVRLRYTDLSPTPG
ncbi:hypothetical protein EDD11_002412 [Mortierella claussenii]|nr:hypothetical protein EDD11_002412 [Mortierella claussenii]